MREVFLNLPARNVGNGSRTRARFASLLTPLAIPLVVPLVVALLAASAGQAIGQGLSQTGSSQTGSSQTGSALVVAKAPVAETLSLWDAAKVGDKAALERGLKALAADADPTTSTLGGWPSHLLTNLDKREADRAARITEINAELDAALAKPETDVTLSESLRHAIELDLVHPTRGSVREQPRVNGLISRADLKARELEASGQLLPAAELFSLLNGLLDIEGTYRPDIERVNQRLTMVRFYAPHRLWEQRDARLKAMGEKPLPPYNPIGDDFRKRLKGVDTTLIIRALAYTPRHIEGSNLNDLVVSGINAVGLMAQTTDLAEAFPKLADKAAVDRFVASVTAQKVAVAKRRDPIDVIALDNILANVLTAAQTELDLPREAVLHEFGNGSFLPLDDYSAIIWPDELRRFEKNTQGRFVGVGVQIEYDEQSAVRVVTPLEGTPAHKAGIHPGDIITQVDGKNIYGLSLDQVVDLITGPAGTPVTMTIDRKGPEPLGADGKVDPANDEPKSETITKTMNRGVIKVATVKGWDRLSSGEYDWNWFVDKDRGIGYVRLTQFADDTGRELDAAIRQMREAGLKGLILDLRFNPGGLLDQAVRVSRRIIKAENGDIVMARGASGEIESRERTIPSQATLADIPVIVLINEGSASASEIVSGAIACHAKAGDADALILGARSFGKGSVQNVWRLTNVASMKLTIQYYMLPDQSIIHRKLGSTKWGVEPNLTIDMLPKQTTDVLTLRRDADVMRIDEKGLTRSATPRPNAEDILTKGLDPQLETALLLLRARVVGGPSQATKQAANFGRNDAQTSPITP